MENNLQLLTHYSIFWLAGIALFLAAYFRYGIKRVTGQLHRCENQNVEVSSRPGESSAAYSKGDLLQEMQANASGWYYRHWRWIAGHGLCFQLLVLAAYADLACGVAALRDGGMVQAAASGLLLLTLLWSSALAWQTMLRINRNRLRIKWLVRSITRLQPPTATGGAPLHAWWCDAKSRLAGWRAGVATVPTGTSGDYVHAVSTLPRTSICIGETGHYAL